MRVLFVAKLIQDRVLTPYGLYVLSAACRKAGHETGIADAVSIGHIKKAIKSFQPDILAFSTHTARWPFFKKAALELKREFGLTQLFGGVHPTFRPDIIKEPFIDGLCVGEGELALPDLLNRLENSAEINDTPNWCFFKNGTIISNPPRPLISDLDNLPMPHFELTDNYHYSRKSPVWVLLTSRGCMFNCSYCSTDAYKKLYSGDSSGYYRRASVSRNILEVKYLMDKYPCEFITFFNDHLTGDREWTMKFADEYGKTGGPPFACQMVVRQVKRDEVRALVHVGLKWVGISLESADPETRSALLNRHYSNEEFKEAISILNEEGVRTLVGNVLALPGSDLDTDIATLRLNREAGAGLADASIFTPFPGTALGEKALENNLFDEISWDAMYLSMDATFKKPLVCNVPHKRYVRRLHCLFDIAGDSKWVAQNLKTLVKLPLTPLYIVAYKLHNILKKRFFLFRETRLPLRIQLSLMIYNILY
jgi:anaerobic magnesium-protoporphyrin IX monomethyl ester cyclase